MTDIRSQLIQKSGKKPARSKAEKSDMLSRYPGKGSEALKKKAHKRKIAQASRRRNRR